jgi:hypothetical protein
MSTPTTSAVPADAAETARALTDHIKTTATSGAKEIAKSLIAAVHMHAWEPLNYPTCAEYLLTEMGEVPLRLSVDDRADVFRAMRDEGGMNLRDIGTVTGYSKDTVQRAVSDETKDKPSDNSSHPTAALSRFRKRVQKDYADDAVTALVQAGFGLTVVKDIDATINLLKDRRAAIKTATDERDQARLADYKNRKKANGRPVTLVKVNLDAPAALDVKA